MECVTGCVDSRGAVQDAATSSSHSRGDGDRGYAPDLEDSEIKNEQSDDSFISNFDGSHPDGKQLDTNANKSVFGYKDAMMSPQEANIRSPEDQTKVTESESQHQNLPPVISCSNASGDASLVCASSGRSDVDASDGALQSTSAEEIVSKPLNEALIDAGRFSYVALCSVNLAILFEDQWNKDWKERMVRSLVKHMKLPKKTCETMMMFMSTPQDLEGAMIFADSLLKDPHLDKPQLLPEDLIGHALAEGQYDARSRVLALHVASLMGVQESEIQNFEGTIVSSFIQEEVEVSEEEKIEKEKRAKMKKVKRFAMIGAAAVGGGALIGLTGGLAAPLIASAGAALLGGSVGFLGTAAGVAVMASVFGAAGAGLTGFKMKRRVGAIEEFEFEAVSSEKDLHVTIAVSGWLTKDTMNNFSVPWLTLASSKEVYCLRWESKYLLALGEALSMILNKMLTMAAKEALKMTVLAGLVVAFALPATAYSSLVAIDNPWSVVTNRAAEAGKQLAEVLLSRHQGKRPVTLIGFSMGARLIFFCLKELANRKGCEGIIQDAVLLGAPVPSTAKYWKPFARVVAGRIINGYCRGDWLLQFVYRAASVQMIDISGLEPVAWTDRRMVNVDLTEIVNGHFDYADKMEEILARIGLRTKSTPMSQNLTKVTSVETGKVGGQTDSSTDELETEFAVIDAGDLLLSGEDPPITQAEAQGNAVAELDGTGHGQLEPVEAIAKEDSAFYSGLHLTETKTELDSKILECGAPLPTEIAGEVVARFQECSITPKGVSSSDQLQDVEVGEEALS
ncbi:transmembrane and coiled-coil domain-containing protein 4-like isoform X2 [Acanthaster planci]|uniref:Transmembrane and coiled-coil domain-containing protein 4-like isoform X2 n=1 Tax=Acanthaster planci TaxID=133434 RepID=A0A8B7Z4S3_ACAPL|nr:transmembrane and coiled-coil domain-containing protein 4-like isoform X2 [Acanthaster planci]